MKVLVCIPCLLTGGTEVQTLSLVKALIEAGHQVVTVCYFEYVEDTVIRFETAGSLVKCLSEQGVRPKGMLHNIKFLYKGIHNVVKSEKPDVAHVQYMAPGAIPIFILRWLGVKKVLATAHTSADIYSLKGLRILRWIVRNLLVCFTCITKRAESSFFGSSQLYYPSFPLKMGRHFTIYNCLSEYIQIAGTPRQFSKEIVIGVVSRLEKIKGMDMIIPAFSLIHQNHSSTRLLVVGDGSLKQFLEQQATTASLQSSVTFVGRQPQERLQYYYDQIDILLMPSRSEGFGLTAIEAMARGCIVVAANVGGLPEVVKNEVSGMLHKSENIDDIAQKVVSLIEQPDMLRKMSEAAIYNASKYSVKSYNQQISDLYQSL